MKSRPLLIAAIALSTLAILIATLHASGTTIARGWSFDLTSGDAAFAELIQNLLLFIPFGASVFTAVSSCRRLTSPPPLSPPPVSPPPHLAAFFTTVAVGALLSFCVEFAQQWIPGRDPSAGDVLCNTVSTALGATLALAADRWLFTPPRRSGWQALAAAIAAVGIWLLTGAMLRPEIPPGPFFQVATPDYNHFGRYHGKVLWMNMRPAALRVGAIAPDRPPARESPVAVLQDSAARKAIMLSIDHADLELRYYMPAIDWTLEQPPLRWPDALRPVAPRDSFTLATWHDTAGNVCLGVRDTQRCRLGYTLGDGWKLIFYPDRFPTWLLTLINALWVAGCVAGVGWWAGRTSGGERSGGGGRRAQIVSRAAVLITLLGLIIVPWITGLKGTTLWEWLGALGGIELGLMLGNAAGGGRLPTAPAQS